MVRIHKKFSGQRRISSANTVPSGPTTDELQSEVSGTTTKIHNGIARSRIERVDDIGGTLPLVPLRFDSRQLLEGSNSLVRNHREAKNKEDGEKDERRTKRADNTLKHAATCFYGRRCG